MWPASTLGCAEISCAPASEIRDDEFARGVGRGLGLGVGNTGLLQARA
jgi:hypothetical protein